MEEVVISDVGIIRFVYGAVTLNLASSVRFEA